MAVAGLTVLALVGAYVAAQASSSRALVASVFAAADEVGSAAAPPRPRRAGLLRPSIGLP